MYSLVDSPVGDNQPGGPGVHQDQRGLGPRVTESCAGKQVSVVLFANCENFLLLLLFVSQKKRQLKYGPIVTDVVELNSV